MMEAGFIGLGAPMAVNLHDDGQLHAAWNRTQAVGAGPAAGAGS